ncbi:MAG: hypothetical protein RLZZ241_422 [Bacteroidota bacterium]|jgi:hypothetical protein
MVLKTIFKKFLLISFLFSCYWGISQDTQFQSGTWDLETLYKAWRTFEVPPLYNGAPDYRKETWQMRNQEFREFQNRLKQIDTTGWPIAKKVDWTLIWAEMNGYAFNENVLKPWERDPAFYKSIWTDQSDVPAHEGPTHHGITELWKYNFPLSKPQSEQLIQDLSVIPPLCAQALENLTGNARELWVAGIRDIRQQITDLEDLKSYSGVSKTRKLVQAIDLAQKATTDLANWLEAEASNKTGPSGIGRDHYTWYQQNVHLVPLTWEEEVMLLKRELARAWSALKLEEHRNRNLPEIKPAASPEAYRLLAEKGARSLVDFMVQDSIVTVKPYFEPALKKHLGVFVPEDKRNFFWITAHHDPRPLYSHFYHWFELARMDKEPNANPIRQEPLLYNIFDSRNEGLATAVEEYFMQAGLYDDAPRSREIVYILLAQRAARGLGSLYAQDNILTMEEAGGIHLDYTPRGWMKTEKELVKFEQHLYMRQPGYGTSYITGKYLLEDAMMEYARLCELKGTTFKVSDFLNQLNDMGNIPVSMAMWELTGFTFR